jgi:hypothetical protein
MSELFEAPMPALPLFIHPQPELHSRLVGPILVRVHSGGKRRKKVWLK